MKAAGVQRRFRVRSVHREVSHAEELARGTLLKEKNILALTYLWWRLHYWSTKGVNMTRISITGGRPSGRDPGYGTRPAYSLKL